MMNLVKKRGGGRTGGDKEAMDPSVPAELVTAGGRSTVQQGGGDEG